MNNTTRAQRINKRQDAIYAACDAANAKRYTKQQSDFEDAILDLIDNRDDYTRSDLQGAVSAIVLRIQGSYKPLIEACSAVLSECQIFNEGGSGEFTSAPSNGSLARLRTEAQNAEKVQP